MHIIITMTSVRDIGSCTNRLHICHYRVGKHGRLLQPLFRGLADNDVLREFGKTLTKEDSDRGFARLDVYKKWFQESFLDVNDDNTLIIMPQESMQPRYRDESPKYVSLHFPVCANLMNSFEHPPPGVNCLAMAAVFKSPALTIPSMSELLQDLLSAKGSYSF